MQQDRIGILAECMAECPVHAGQIKGIVMQTVSLLQVWSAQKGSGMHRDLPSKPPKVPNRVMDTHTPMFSSSYLSYGLPWAPTPPETI